MEVLEGDREMAEYGRNGSQIAPHLATAGLASYYEYDQAFATKPSGRLRFKSSESLLSQTRNEA